MNIPLRRSGMARVVKGSHSFTCTPHVHPLPSQPKLVLIYRPLRDGRLSWPRNSNSGLGARWCRTRDYFSDGIPFCLPPSRRECVDHCYTMLLCPFYLSIFFMAFLFCLTPRAKDHIMTKKIQLYFHNLLHCVPCHIPILIITSSFLIFCCH